MGMELGMYGLKVPMEGWLFEVLRGRGQSKISICVQYSIY